MANQESPLPKLDSLVTAIHNTLQNKFDGKASQSDLAAHTNDTSTHLSSNDRAKVNDILTATSAQSTYTLKSTFNSHKNNSNIHVTAAQMTEWDSKAAGVHTHAIDDITGLQNTLDSKAASTHVHDIDDITGLQDALDNKAADVHTHNINDITGLQDTLDGKATSTHAHDIADITGLQNVLDGKAASTHTHAINDIAGLQDTLDSKASDNAVVHKSGAETISGTKQFISTIVGDITGNAGTCKVRFINLVNNNDDLARVMNFAPPSLADVFNTWYRFSHANDYVQYNSSNVEGNALLDMEAWAYDSENNAIINNRNTDTYVGFVSPDTYNKFIIKTEIGGLTSNNDNDSLSIIIAFMRDVNGIEHHISVVRDGGRNSEEYNKFNLVYDYNYTGFGGSKVVLASGKDLITTTSGWKNHTALLYAERDGNKIIVKTTEIDSEDFTATLTYTLPEDKGDLDEEDYRNIKYMLSNKCQIGFGLHSQIGQFKLLEMSNIFDDLNIFDAANDVIYEYINGSYVQTNRKVSDELEDYTRAYNKNIKKEFIYYDGVAYDEAPYSAGSNLSLSGTTFNVSNTPSFTSITIGGYTITID